MKYPLIDSDQADNTRDRILLTAVKMFSISGFSAVSMRDIAAEVQIKPASIYHHFDSKEAIFDSIIEVVDNVYMDFYDRTNHLVDKAESFAQLLDCLFAELKDVYHMFIHYGVGLLSAEQFRNEKARAAFIDVYMGYGIDYSTRLFNDAIAKGWVEPFDTRALATIFMNNVYTGTLMRVHEDMGSHALYDVSAMYTQLQAFMLSAVGLA